MNQRPLTKEEKKELIALNDAVTAAIEARRDWLDKKMVECSKIKVGDDIYNLDTGHLLGKVTKLFRFWRDHDDGVRDRSHYCEYAYHERTYGNVRLLDNTSRQTALRFGLLTDLKKNYT